MSTELTAAQLRIDELEKSLDAARTEIRRSAKQVSDLIEWRVQVRPALRSLANLIEAIEEAEEDGHFYISARLDPDMPPALVDLREAYLEARNHLKYYREEGVL